MVQIAIDFPFPRLWLFGEVIFAFISFPFIVDTGPFLIYHPPYCEGCRASCSSTQGITSPLRALYPRLDPPGASQGHRRPLWKTLRDLLIFLNHFLQSKSLWRKEIHLGVDERIG